MFLRSVPFFYKTNNYFLDDVFSFQLPRLLRCAWSSFLSHRFPLSSFFPLFPFVRLFSFESLRRLFCLRCESEQRANRKAKGPLFPLISSHPKRRADGPTPVAQPQPAQPEHSTADTNPSDRVNHWSTDRLGGWPLSATRRMEPGGARRAGVCLLLRRLLLLMLIAIVGPTTTTPTHAHAHQPAAGSSAHTAARSRAPPVPAWETAQTAGAGGRSSASTAVAPGLHNETRAHARGGVIEVQRATQGAVATVTALQLLRRRRAGAAAAAASVSAAAPGPPLSESHRPSLFLAEPVLSAYSAHERAVQLRLISTPSSTTFLARVAQEYHINDMRPEADAPRDYTVLAKGFIDPYVILSRVPI